jgi:DNA-binding GntR family transcriptional regulator
MTKNHQFPNLAIRAENHLKAHAGKQFEIATLATLFGVEYQPMRSALQKLKHAGTIRGGYIEGRTCFYVPTAEQQAARQVGFAPAFKPYQLPQVMRELAARLQAERDAIPSKYHQEAA